jgi:hypothetical protein
MRTTRVFSFVSAVACLVLASGCKSTEGVVNPYIAVAGNYTLLTANGQLPLRFQAGLSGETTVDITSGILMLTATGTFQEVLQYHVTPPPPAIAYDGPSPTSGTYRLDGSNVTFTYIPGNGGPSSWGGTVADGTLTYTDPNFPNITGGLTAVYTK